MAKSPQTLDDEEAELKAKLKELRAKKRAAKDSFFLELGRAVAAEMEQDEQVTTLVMEWADKNVKGKRARAVLGLAEQNGASQASSAHAQAPTGRHDARLFRRNGQQ